MTPPELGKTAFEVVSHLQPEMERMFREMASAAVSKDEVVALTTEVGRMANELGRMNGTVRGLCEWRAAMQERDKVEAEYRQETPKQTPMPPAPKPEELSTKANPIDVKELVNMILGWAWKFVLAAGVLAGGLNAAKIAEVMLK